MDYESRLRDVESGLQTEDAKLRVHQALKNGLVQGSKTKAMDSDFFSSSEFRIMKKSLVRYGSSRSFNSRIFSHI